MVGGSSPRSVTVERVAAGRMEAVNPRGGRVSMGNGSDVGFSPTELLLAAIGGCTAIDVDTVTSRRAEPDRFEIVVDANKVRDASGNRLTDIEVTFRIRFPEGDKGDAARAVLPDIVQRSHDRLCSVSRTIELGTPVAVSID